MDHARLAVAVLAAALACAPAYAAVDQKHLDQYGKGIIQDYSDMTKGEQLEWVWVAPQVKLSEHRMQLGKVENLTSVVDTEMEETVENDLPRTLERAGARDAKAPVLKVDAAIYWANRANTAKAWIPFAGGHLMQAGVGIELVFRDAKGAVVSKVRHSGREGADLKRAAQELIDEFGQFVRSN